MELLGRMDRFLRRSAMPPTLFGRAAAGDPNLVRELRNGREPGPAMIARINAFLDRVEQEGGSSCAG
jgi:hypothetical protein